ncbi:hypothetical protein ACFSDG_24650 [Pseudarcicella hirudinis]|nr:hypothetical protein [Pseudarcicella hirudinis]
MPELEKKVFLDVFAKVCYDGRLSKPHLKTIEGQHIPADLKVGCPAKILLNFPEGTIYKLDARLIQKNGRRPYFLTISHKRIQRAIEFFEYNLQLQKGIRPELKAKKSVSFEKNKK